VLQVSHRYSPGISVQVSHQPLLGGFLGGRSAAWSAAEPGRSAAGAAGIAGCAIPLSEVSFEGKGLWPGGRGAVRRYLEEALDRMGISDSRARANWISGMTTIADHESAFRADAINVSDSNAHGPRQADGGPLNSSRGPWQLVPCTFCQIPPARHVKPHLGSGGQCVRGDELPHVTLRGGS
jgi:hypothetical protein